LFFIQGVGRNLQVEIFLNYHKIVSNPHKHTIHNPKPLKESMLVQCPGCRTTYRVSEDAVATSNPIFRCSRCKNVFVLGGKGPSKPARQRTDAPRADSPELSFTFDAPVPHAETKPVEEVIPPAEIPHPPHVPSDGEKEILDVKDVVPDSAVNHQAARDWQLEERPAERDFAPRKMNAEPRFTAKPEAARHDKPAEPAFVFTREPEPKNANGAETAAEAKRPLSVAPFLFLSGVLLIACASVTLLYKARPEPIEKLLKSVPLLGSSMVRNDYLRQGIVLQSVTGRFQRIQGNRDIFLLSGVAVNRNRVRVREVKIEGYTYARDGAVLESHVITIGNAISPKIIRDLTEQEIKDLQKTGPVRRFEIQPDESVPFSIVFVRPNVSPQSFGYRVVSADES
jgi:predicted Zn finger-like uncharacterized protein